MSNNTLMAVVLFLMFGLPFGLIGTLELTGHGGKPQNQVACSSTIARAVALYSRPPLPSQWDREIVVMLALRGCAQLAGELCGDHAGCYGQKLERCLWH